MWRTGAGPSRISGLAGVASNHAQGRPGEQCHDAEDESALGCLVGSVVARLKRADGVGVLWEDAVELQAEDASGVDAQDVGPGWEVP